VILLARHGETDWNRPPGRVQGSLDVPLNAAGRGQARALAEAVAGERLASVWSSHLSRARETAEIVAGHLGLESRVDARLAESDRGRWQGRLVPEIAAREPETWAAWRRAGTGFRFPGGESLAEHLERVVSALSDVAEDGALPALVVCHGGSIRAALCHAHGRGLEHFHEWSVPNGALVRL
jgi:broad specificity phosphatase PhoE